MNERAPVPLELSLGELERLGDPLQRDVEAVGQPGLIKEAQLLGTIVTPVITVSPDEVTGGVAPAQTPIL